MRALFETLEHRRLMSVRPEGVVVDDVPVQATPAVRRGVLAVYGSTGDDNISVRIVPAKTGFQVAVRVVSGRTVDGKLDGRVTQSVLTPADQVARVLVVGNGGQDQLVTDVTAYKFTKSVDVDARVVASVNKKGRTVFAEDPMSIAMVGVLAGSTSKWSKRSYGDIVRLRPKEDGSNVLFLGNSHVNYLPQTGATVFKEKFDALPNVNLGLPGDTTSQLLYRIQQQNMLFRAGYVKVVVVEIGSNNVALSDDVDAIARGVEAVVAEIRSRLPNAKILLNSILPRRTNAENKVINKVNDRLEALCNPPVGKQRKAKRLFFLDVTPDFTGDRALQRYYRPNDIHLNSRGYRVWVSRLAPLIDQILGVAS